MLPIDQVHTLKTTDIILQNLTVASEEGIPMTLFPHKVTDIIQSQGIPSAPLAVFHLAVVPDQIYNNNIVLVPSPWTDVIITRSQL